MLLKFLKATILLLVYEAHAQDSLLHKLDTPKTSDSHSFYSIDSLQRDFHHRSDSVQKAFVSPLFKLDAEINSLHHKKDSLSHLNLPTQSLSHRLDSLQKVKSLKAKELDASIEKIKKESLSKISSLHLQPQAQGEIDKLSKSISGYSVPTNFFQLKIPGMNMPLNKIPSLNLPSNFTIPAMSIPSLQKLDVKNIAQLPSLEKYKNELAQMKQLKSKVNEKELEKLALKEASQLSGMKELQGQQGKLTEMKSQLDKVKEANPQQAAQMAVNHFAGKEQQLKSAMDQVAKYKQKYSSVKSLAELPKRPPNPLKGKPWYERTMFGVNYFVMSKSYTMVDFNPYVTWKFTPHLSASIGWNERIGISHWNFHTNKYDRVFGLRTGVNYIWTHGIVFKIAPEVMNAFIPVDNNIDSRREAAVWSMYAGVRKDFPIYKKIKGYSEVLYNFAQSPGKNIYGDAVSFRFGIETSFQKKAKKGQGNIVSAASILDRYKYRFKKIRSPKDSFQIVTKNNLQGVVNVKGDTVIAPQFSSVQKFLKKANTHFIVSLNNKFGAVDGKGKIIIPIEKTTSRSVKKELVIREVKHLDLDKLSKEANYYKIR